MTEREVEQEAGPGSPPEAAPPAAAAPQDASRPATLELGVVGWVLLASAGLALAVGAWLLHATRGAAPTGAPIDAGFALEPCLVPRALLVRAGGPSALPPLDLAGPAGRLAPAAALDLKVSGHSKLLKPLDRVIGVAVGGEARAYPVRLLNWHEVALDEVGGVPLAVTWSGLADAARVFDRRVDGEVLDLAASGWVLRSNLVLYDRRPAGQGEGSLWGQLEGRAVAGPMAARGARLAVVPSTLVPWSEWVARHPETTVAAPDLSRAKLYKQDPWSRYGGDDLVRFPTEPAPPAGPLRLKDRVVAVGRPGAWRVYSLAAASARGAPWQVEQEGVALTLRRAQGEPDCLVVEQAPPPGGAALEVVPAFWFAWWAAHATESVLVE